jgi:glyoxylase-like metal-dependent hydrolase (beta-lactamase superfamily II)
MHLDHAGGLPDFPAARVHLLADELEAYLHPRTLMERYAYRAEHHAHDPKWEPHQLQGDRWFGLPSTPSVRIGEAKFVLIPFTGHTRGHCGVALGLDDRWLLHCGDVCGYHPQVDPAQPYTHPSGKLMEWLVTTAFKMPKRHWLSIRELLSAHGDRIQVFCSHDAREFESLRTHEGAPPHA